MVPLRQPQFALDSVCLLGYKRTPSPQPFGLSRGNHSNPRPTAGTIEGTTPNSDKHRSWVLAAGYSYRIQEIFLSTPSACLVSLLSPKREFLSQSHGAQLPKLQPWAKGVGRFCRSGEGMRPGCQLSLWTSIPIETPLPLAKVLSFT